MNTGSRRPGRRFRVPEQAPVDHPGADSSTLWGVQPEPPPAAASSLWSRFWASRSAVTGAVILATMGTLALLAPLVLPYSPISQLFPTLQPPSFDHPFGTDELGRDVLSRVLNGAGVSLVTAAGAASIAAVVGVPIGLVGGYFSGWVDAVGMRVMDVVLAVPDIIFALVIVAILGPGDWNTLIAIAIVSVPAFARLTRASTLSLRGLDYVRAERAMGASDADIIFRTILPNSVGPIIVQLVITASLAILIEAGLSFLGLGTQPPHPSWGGMLQTSRSYLSQDPWYGIFPGLALAVTIGGLDSLGRGLHVVLGGRSSTANKPVSVG